MTKPLVAVFGSSQAVPGTDEWETGMETGRLLARAGYGVITGGYGGIMESSSLGARSEGADAVGVIAPHLFPGRSGANPHVSEVLEAQDLTTRIGMIIERASGAIALPGSIGTAAELFVAWNVNHITRRNGGRRIPVAAVGPAWRRVGALVSDEIGAVVEDVCWCEDALQAVAWVVAEIAMATDMLSRD